MITRQELEGKWNELKGTLQKKWGALTDDDLQRVKGNASELVGVIQQRTGESRQAIEAFLDKAMKEGSSVAAQAAEYASEYADQAKEYVQQASDRVRDEYDHLSESVSAGYEDAEEMVRRKPVESVAVAFGAGIITGAIVGLMLHSRS